MYCCMACCMVSCETRNNCIIFFTEYFFHHILSPSALKCSCNCEPWISCSLSGENVIDGLIFHEFIYCSLMFWKVSQLLTWVNSRRSWILLFWRTWDPTKTTFQSRCWLWISPAKRVSDHGARLLYCYSFYKVTSSIGRDLDFIMCHKHVFVCRHVWLPRET